MMNNLVHAVKKTIWISLVFELVKNYINVLQEKVEYYLMNWHILSGWKYKREKRARFESACTET
jgi:hypothetical protein